MQCSQCGATLPEAARFCPQCGTRVIPPGPPPPDIVWSREGAAALAQQQAQPEPETQESPAGEADASASATSEPLPPAPPVPVTETPQTEPTPAEPAAARFDMPNLQVIALAGLLVAAVATFLPWSRAAQGDISETASAWNSAAQFRLAGFLDTSFPLDAAIVLIVAGFGVFLIIAQVIEGGPPQIRHAVPGAGGVLFILGALNLVYIVQEAGRVEDIGINLQPGIGVYAVILGGLASFIAGYLDESRRFPVEVPGSGSSHDSGV